MINFLTRQFMLFRRFHTACRLRDRIGDADRIPPDILVAKLCVGIVHHRWHEGYEPSSRELDIAQSCRQEIMIWEWEGEG